MGPYHFFTMKSPIHYSTILNILFPTLFLYIFPFSGTAQIYVDQNANGNNSGINWANAYNDLQVALANANPGDTIRVAEGIYRPAPFGGDTTATFLINKNLVLLGGFNATTETQDPTLFPTLLSGDLNGDDVDNNVLVNRADNVLHVVTISTGITNTTVLEGVTIQSGHADGPQGFDGEGGGLFSSGAPTLRNCTFAQNYAFLFGGALLQDVQTDGPLVLEDCLFEKNIANVGGAMLLFEVPYQINNCLFQNNATLPGTYDATAGAMYISNASGSILNSTFLQNASIGSSGCLAIAHGDNFDNAAFELVNCTFEDNQSETGGGSLQLSIVGTNAFSTYEIEQCSFIQCQNNDSGGGINISAGINTLRPTILVNDCLFTDNSTELNAGALWANLASEDADFQMRNCEVINNESGSIGAVVLVGSGTGTGTIEVDSSYFEGNQSFFSGGLEMSNIDNASMDFVVSNSIFTNNEAEQGGGLGMYIIGNTQTDVLIEDCQIDGNTSIGSGGGLQLWPDADNINVRINRTSIINNQSIQGGGLDAYVFNADLLFPDNTSISVANSLIANNQSPDAAITLNRGGHLNLINTTVAGNSNNGIRLSNQSTLTIQNTILHNLGDQEFESTTPDAVATSNGGNLFRDDSFSAFAQLNDLQNTDPLLTTDFRLSNESPAIDKGVNSGAFILDKDLDGNNRVNGCIDIGAFENQEVVTPECANSVEELMAKNQLTLFPNPATDLISIQIPAQREDSFDLQLFHSSGQLVHQQRISIGEAVNIDQLPSGWYLVEVRDGSTIYRGKLVKQ